MALLSVRNLTRRFGGIIALYDVSLDVEEGTVVGLIGPNGAGKTTAFNLISGLDHPDEGNVVFDGQSLARTPAHRVVRRGIARTFQNVELFRSLTVLENVLVAVRGARRPRRRRAERALEYLELGDVAQRQVGALRYSTQKRVELARALAAEPRLLLLDEPAGGLDLEEVAGLGRFLAGLHADLGVTVLLVEHQMRLVMQVCARVHVLDFGRLIAQGSPEEVQRDPAVMEAYLGRPRAA